MSWKLVAELLRGSRLAKGLGSMRNTKTLKLTDKESKYIKELMDDADILDEAPSLRVKGNQLMVEKNEIIKLSDFLDDSYVWDKGKNIPPRIRDSYRPNSLTNKLLQQLED